MLKIGMLVMVRDPWIQTEVMVPPATIIAINKEEDKFLLQWKNGFKHWFHRFSLKTE